MSGGKSPYSIQTEPNSAIASAEISGSTVTITGKSAGQTSVVVKDSSTPAKTVTITITISGTSDLVIPQNVALSVGDTTSNTISGGTPSYSVQTPPEGTIAKIDISDSTITVTGMGVGQTSATIQDSSTPPKTVTIQITVNAPGDLIIEKNISINPGESKTTSISGGIKDYSIQTGPDETVAKAFLVGTSLTVLGVAPGQTSMVVADSSTPAKTATVTIVINGKTDLAVAQNIILEVDGSTDTPISGGKGPYSIETQPNSAIANAEISGSTLSVTAIAPGKTSVTVKDSSTPPKSATVTIGVNKVKEGGVGPTPALR
jgi:hypothetical protein